VLSQKTLLSLTAATLLAVATACGGSSGGTTPAMGTPPPGAGDVQLFAGSGDVRPGPNRFLMALLTKDGTPVSDASVKLDFRPLTGNTAGPIATTVQAQYLGKDSESAKSLYSARVTFPKPGNWEADATVTKDGKSSQAKAQFVVRQTTGVPNIGESIPASNSPTSPPTPVEQLTSQRPVGDADFYKLSIAESLKTGKASMIIFATPAFCQTRTCGPQLEALQGLKQKYAAQVNFIHIEVYQRPDLLLQGQGQPKLAETVTQWHLESEPWVFLVDKSGKVFDRFEGYAPAWEVEPSLQKLLTT